ncbi:MAG: PAC2 family protein [Deltaproteobacteria bacterium]|jgi:proteasome assembly chaperone (PAC2) family protein|nr:PAC2 family protein [Deltaproteobacteria bacterium]
MNDPGINIRELPQLEKPLLIAGFNGWGNALNISDGMASYLIRHFGARPFAELNPDIFYRYDEQRPRVSIENGLLKNFILPKGSFYSAATDKDQSDVVILNADEPNLGWMHFVDLLFSLCRKLDVGTVITLGSMYDNVLHTDRIVSGVASTSAMLTQLQKLNVNAISYQGPSAIHSIIQSEGTRRGFECISLWSHCPYYLQGTTHFGILSHLGRLIARLGNFHLDTEKLDKNWKTLKEQINTLIESNDELQKLIASLRKEKAQGSPARLDDTAAGNQKIINLQDFLDPQ